MAIGVVHRIIADLFSEVRTLYEEGIEVLCPDGKIRIGHPFMGGWIADYMELLKIFAIQKNSCPLCDIDPQE
ncbi:hypothetical protein BJ508DRAFT_219077, partial [Ascobolus immersus RN42]